MSAQKKKGWTLSTSESRKGGPLADRITALPVENRITFEAVYSAQNKQKKRTPATKSSVNDLVHKLFEPKKPQVLGMEVVRGILERYSGAMDLSAAGGSEILRIIINN